jgi:uncharacterized membrane protein
MTPATKAPERQGRPADIHDDGDTVRRSVTVRRPLDEVRRAWSAAGIPGEPQFATAPGKLGTEVRVTAPKDHQSALKEIIGAWTSDDPGESLSTRLRQFKAQVETGEIATTHGQPSGREAKAE